MLFSPNISKLAPALVKAQSMMAAAQKTATNPYHKSKYADLPEVIDAIKEALNSNGITFLQPLSSTPDGRITLFTILLHESGEYLYSETIIPAKKEFSKDKTGTLIPESGEITPQSAGSAITYFRRYALQSIVGLPTEDDDGEKAMGRTQACSTPRVATISAPKYTSVAVATKPKYQVPETAEFKAVKEISKPMEVKSLSESSPLPHEKLLKLVDERGVKWDLVDKVCTQAGVSTVAELSSERIAEFIRYIEEKFPKE